MRGLKCFIYMASVMFRESRTELDQKLFQTERVILGVENCVNGLWYRLGVGTDICCSWSRGMCRSTSECRGLCFKTVLVSRNQIYLKKKNSLQIKVQFHLYNKYMQFNQTKLKFWSYKYLLNFKIKQQLLSLSKFQTRAFEESA